MKIHLLLYIIILKFTNKCFAIDVLCFKAQGLGLGSCCIGSLGPACPSDLSTSCCLADLFCIPVLEPPCCGSACLIHTTATVVDALRLSLFYLSLHLHISALLLQLLLCYYF